MRVCCTRALAWDERGWLGHMGGAGVLYEKSFSVRHTLGAATAAGGHAGLVFGCVWRCAQSRRTSLAMLSGVGHRCAGCEA